jgi:mRNA-degrading endonuclease RelE of RelBE toxin-antitoxin system
MTWELVVANSAQKQLQKLPPKDRDRVKAVLLAMRENPFSGDVVRLKGQDAAWRRRVG